MKPRLSRGLVALVVALGCERPADRPTDSALEVESPVIVEWAAPDSSVTNSEFGGASLTAWAAEQGLPAFDDFPSSGTFSGTPAPVDLTSDEGARRFRTVLRQGSERGPNFATDHTIVTWGCGSPCTAFAVVSAVDGRVFMQPGGTVWPPLFRSDSRLLITDPARYATDSLGHPLFPTITYYEWTGAELVLIDSINVDGVRFIER